jgi:CAAX protease family protein
VNPDTLLRVAGLRLRRRSRRLPLTLAIVIAVLAAVGALQGFLPLTSRLALAPVVALGLIGLGRWAGLSWDDLGLAAGSWRRGAMYGGVAVVLVAAVYAVGAALPLTRMAFLDARYQLSPGPALVTALVVIPLRTVLLEEVAFRGVLLGLLHRHRSGLWASLISSILFGLWHVLPSLHLHEANRAVTAAVGQGAGARLVVVLAVVAFTGLAGMLFCELRRRSTSLLASVSLHWGTNGIGLLLAALLWAGHR